MHYCWPAAILPNARLLNQWIRRVPSLKIRCMWILHLREFGSTSHSLVDRRTSKSPLLVGKISMFIRHAVRLLLFNSSVSNIRDFCIRPCCQTCFLLHQRLRCPWFPRSCSLSTISRKEFVGRPVTCVCTQSELSNPDNTERYLLVPYCIRIEVCWA